MVATTDPDTLPKDDTWCLRTNLQIAHAPVSEIVRLYGLREWVEVFRKQAKGQLGWADWEVRRGRAIQRHWHLVFCAYTFTLLHGRLAEAAEKKGHKRPTVPVDGLCPSRLGLAAAVGRSAPLVE